jgi:hypothetical protein
VIRFEDLNLQKTIDVNTRRGFRVVMRSQSIEQYLRDHPYLTPPLLRPAQKTMPSPFDDANRRTCVRPTEPQATQRRNHATHKKDGSRQGLV